MTVQTYVDLSMDNDQVCDFLITGQPVLSYKPSIAEILEQDGFTLDSKDIIPVDDTSEEIGLCYYEETKWRGEEHSSGLPRGEFRTFKTFRAPCAYQLEIRLYLAPGLAPDLQAQLRTIFAGLDQSRLQNDGMTYVNELITAADQAGATVDDYYAILSYSLYRTNEDKALSDTFDTLDAELGQDVKFTKISSEKKCGVPDLGFDGSERPVNDVTDEAEIDAIIEDELTDIAEPIRCHDLAYRKHRVGTVLAYPEFKVVWRKKRIKVGRCTFATIYYPQFFTRIRKNVLYASTAIPSSVVGAMEKGAIECLILAATSTGLIAIISGGMTLPVAGQVFAAAFTNCIKVKFGTGIRCIIPKLTMIVEHSAWNAV